MEKQLQDLEVQTKLLAFTRKKTDGVIGKRNTEGIERQRDSLRAITKKVEDLKIILEQAKFEAGEKQEDIESWSQDVEEQQAAADEDIMRLEGCINDAKQEALAIAKENEEKLLAKSRQAQLEFEKAQLELQIGYGKKSDEPQIKEKSASKQSLNAKLPKLVITKFNGGYTDWQRFWNQFEAEIDRADVASVTKFSYLKELVEPNVRATIDGLPFNTEGYERAKNILKGRYGKTSEIVNAYIRNIMSLPKVSGSHPSKIHEFYQILLTNVQALQTMGRLGTVNGYVRMTLDKLEGIRGDLVRTDDDWQEWDFSKLVDALQKWTTRNPIPVRDALCEQARQDKHARNQDKLPRYRSQVYQIHQSGWKRTCVYCDGPHKAIECEKVNSVGERKKILSTKRLCFNCTGEKHIAAECKSRALCQKCKQAHHTSICDQKSEANNACASETKAKSDKMMTATTSTDSPVIYPVVVVKVEGVMCRALLDTGAGSSYASAALLDRIGVHPHRREVRQIEMMLESVTKELEISKVKVESISGDFKLEISVTKVNKHRLLDLDNPRYQDCISSHAHLAGVEMQDTDTKKRLPVHLILGASDYAKIKMQTAPRIGAPGEPIAEQTKFGWTIMSPGKEVDLSSMFLAQTSTVDYENLCRLDVLGLQDFPEGDQNQVYHEFKEQLVRSPEGWYETGLPWKGNHPPLPNNETGSLRRLQTLERKLEKQGLTESYNKIIQEQLEAGIVERATNPPNGREFYIPHKPVIREAAESTKLRVVYDGSARAYDNAPSLNECLNPGPPLQNHVLVRARFYPVAITGDIKQAFLQVRIREEDRDALRFHWLKDLDTKTVETLRFTRALFGLAPSPFLLGGVLKHHLEVYKSTYPEIVGEIEKSLYVDDLISGGPTIEHALQIKSTATEIFAKGGFELHKWHSSARELETAEQSSNGDVETFAKEQLGIPKGGESTLLGLTWSKEADTVSIRCPSDAAQPTKRGILGKVARIYDPLGLASPVTLGGKFLYCDACVAKLAWDTELPSDLIKKWSRWESLPDKIPIPRSIATHQEEIEEVELHAFGDASGKGVCAAVYAVIKQPSGVSQGLVTAKARLAKRGLTIPRLELVSGHMAVNLITNVCSALNGLSITSRHCWLDSSVALHWIRGQGQYKQFVNNRVEKIQKHPEIAWHHVSTNENPADLGSRSGKVSEHNLWWNGPPWLRSKDSWPSDINTEDTPESKAEERVVREVLSVAVTQRDELDDLLEKYGLLASIESVRMDHAIH